MIYCLGKCLISESKVVLLPCNIPIPPWCAKKISTLPPGPGLPTSLDVHSADALIPLLRDGVAKALTLRNHLGGLDVGVVGSWLVTGFNVDGYSSTTSCSLRYMGMILHYTID